MDDRQARRPEGRRSGRPAAGSTAAAVGAFLSAGLVVVLVLGAVLALVQQRMTTQEAVDDATALTASQADVLAGSLTSEALVPGSAQDQLDRVVRQRVLGDRVVRVKIWSEDGRVLYSDDRDLIGHSFELAADELAALRTGAAVSEVSDLREAENTGEAQYGKLLQVYLGLRTPDGRPLLFETYQPYEGVEQASERLWRASLPVLFGGLALLYLLQAPLAYRMARRLRAAQEERERLLVASLASADREKAQIVDDLHGGVVQGLAGTSYALTVAATQARSEGHPQLAETVHAAAVDLRRWVRELRSLIVRVAPPPARRHGLEAALVDLLGSVDGSGLAVDLSVDGGLDLEETTGSLVYRVVQESLCNVVRQATARSVAVRLQVDDDVLRLQVVDDGPPRARGRAAGSEGLGLELLASVVEASGGRLTATPAPEGGTVVDLTLPVCRPVLPEGSEPAAPAAPRLRLPVR